ncbi:MAG: M23 family metallopeptidase, partial [Cetobacterium sp.]
GETKFHHGTDIGHPDGGDQVSPKDGTISFAGDYGTGGQTIKINHGSYTTILMHLSEYKCKVGDKVKRGQVVGLTGSTGGSTGPHCHWEMRRNSDNESFDPAPKLQKGDNV